MSRRNRHFQLLLSCLAFLAFLLAGCGKDAAPPRQGPQVTVEGGEGAGEKVTVEGEEGQSDIEVTQAEPSEEALGIPFYPGAEVVPGSGLSSRTVQGEKTLETLQAELTTPDAFKKVVSWYRNRLGQPLEETAEGATWVIREESETVRSVMVEPGEGKTSIKVLKISGDLDIDIQGQSP